MIIGVMHAQDGRVVQRLSASNKVAVGLPPNGVATIPPSSITSSSCSRTSRPTGLGGKLIRNGLGTTERNAGSSTLR
jgi:hypothetical protein